MATCKCGAYLAPELENCNVCGRSAILQQNLNAVRTRNKTRKKRGIYGFSTRRFNLARTLALITGCLFVASGVLPWFNFHYKDYSLDVAISMASSEYGAFCVLGGSGLIFLTLFFKTYARGLLVILLFIAIGGTIYELYTLYDAYNQLSSLGSLFGFNSNAEDVYSYISKYVSLRLGAVTWILALVFGLISNRRLEEHYGY